MSQEGSQGGAERTNRDLDRWLAELWQPAAPELLHEATVPGAEPAGRTLCSERSSGARHTPATHPY